ncbi:oxygen-independent coproporphyrinogen III oxidase [Erwinia sp. OLTSP20]|uniref:oxygen-independent coproporphyrinogen III oxidase n=1 Tax=unclassified Erwinia TaxID=2622719 RepID=UPI000C18D9F9|nr:MULTISPECIES: oxygen-independent coproporphyrinogen III oxidase [unclassified Erwinia]PIJ49323.1 oxygen-independent coproporphyrinogen III oxidase [Erwinia sp. OAMSP11]PIJ70588.1 oxygen-independent coproporphyrinogen III oxidase [Erwinia sp. OLSSP12]PIJ80001.1 oxygen-independent coproporphyrinogen III oxidase [Erwinia sp. OLCASP19]PIJ81789.1 oxygen-independent coproporphyrinogen III oxidase [Erwinia sp. OLMTSP26]PIJ84739.1 oxygen-independent coproporphyrinogen III oxidase [Erwinia sp. OLMDS
MSMPEIEWDQALIEKYNASGPRYTSYPTALDFNDSWQESAFRIAANRYPDRPLSLYLHIPFCHRLCYFCGCNKQVTRQQHKAEAYLVTLAEEIKARAALFRQRKVSQMHWGGGTPTFLTAGQIERLMTLLRAEFDFSRDAEISIEIDPREIPLTLIDHLSEQGFNRLSMGVQDFNKTVQERVNRVQDEEFIFALVARARQMGFKSTSIDLIYGLPMQTPESFAFTLQRVLALRPDRLSVFNYAHLPTLFAAQRKIREAELPPASDKLMILQQTITTLCAAGYQFIGMDHFALPDDELAQAQRRGQLHRNFQGYTTQGDCDLLGMGVSAISMMGDSYGQNDKELRRWAQRIEAQGSAVARGLDLTTDDRVRRDVIKSLICNFSLDFMRLNQHWGIDAQRYFADDLARLQPMVADGLIECSALGLRVTAKGRLLIRNICMCFDNRLQRKLEQRQYSRVI